MTYGRGATWTMNQVIKQAMGISPSMASGIIKMHAAGYTLDKILKFLYQNKGRIANDHGKEQVQTRKPHLGEIEEQEINKKRVNRARVQGFLAGAVPGALFGAMLPMYLSRYAGGAAQAAGQLLPAQNLPRRPPPPTISISPIQQGQQPPTPGAPSPQGTSPTGAPTQPTAPQINPALQTAKDARELLKNVGLDNWVNMLSKSGLDQEKIKQALVSSPDIKSDAKKLGKGWQQRIHQAVDDYFAGKDLLDQEEQANATPNQAAATTPFLKEQEIDAAAMGQPFSEDIDSRDPMVINLPYNGGVARQLLPYLPQEMQDRPFKDTMSILESPDFLFQGLSDVFSDIKGEYVGIDNHDLMYLMNAGVQSFINHKLEKPAFEKKKAQALEAKRKRERIREPSEPISLGQKKPVVGREKKGRFTKQEFSQGEEVILPNGKKAYLTKIITEGKSPVGLVKELNKTNPTRILLSKLKRSKK